MVHNCSKSVDHNKVTNPFVERVARISKARDHFNRISQNQDKEADKRNKRQLRNKSIESDWAKSTGPRDAGDNQIAQMLKARTKYNEMSKDRIKKAEERQRIKLERLSLNKKLDNIQSELHDLRNLNDHLLKSFGVGHQLAKLIRDQDQEYEKLKKKCDQIAEVRIYERQKQAAMAKKILDLQRQSNASSLAEQDKSNLQKLKEVKDKYSHLKLVNRSTQSSMVKNKYGQESLRHPSLTSQFGDDVEGIEKTTASRQEYHSKDKSISIASNSIKAKQLYTKPMGIQKLSAPFELQRTIALKAVQRMNLVQVPICISTNRVKPAQSGTCPNKIDVQTEKEEIHLHPNHKVSTPIKSVTLPKESFEKLNENDKSTIKDLKCNICHKDLQDLSRLTLDTTLHSHINTPTYKNQKNFCSTNYSICETVENNFKDQHNSASSDGITFEELSSSSLSLSTEDTNSKWFKDENLSLSNSSCETLNSDDITLETTNKSFFNSTEIKIISDAANITHRLRAMLKDVDERCYDVSKNIHENELSNY